MTQQRKTGGRPRPPTVGAEIEPPEGDQSSARADRPVPPRDPDTERGRARADPTDGRGIGTEVEDGSRSSQEQEP